MEKVEYKKIKNSLILLCLQEIINKKKSLKGSLKNKEDVVLLIYCDLKSRMISIQDFEIN
jgi:hypothetical protein